MTLTRNKGERASFVSWTIFPVPPTTQHEQADPSENFVHRSFEVKNLNLYNHLTFNSEYFFPQRKNSNNRLPDKSSTPFLWIFEEKWRNLWNVKLSRVPIFNIPYCHGRFRLSASIRFHNIHVSSRDLRKLTVDVAKNVTKRHFLHR